MSAVSFQKALNLAEYALAEREALVGSTDTAKRAADLRCAAAGLLVLSELGAASFCGDGESRPSVELGRDLEDGKTRFAPYEDLLGRLGWVRDSAYWHRDCDPLQIVYSP